MGPVYLIPLVIDVLGYFYLLNPILGSSNFVILILLEFFNNNLIYCVQAPHMRSGLVRACCPVLIISVSFLILGIYIYMLVD